MAVAIDRPKKKLSQILREWPEEKWWGAGKKRTSWDQLCASLIVHETVHGCTYELLGPERADLLVQANDECGKAAAADLLESWGL